MASTAQLRVVNTPCHPIGGVRPSTRGSQPHGVAMTLMGTQLLGGAEAVPCSHASVASSNNTFPERFRHVLRCNPTSTQSCDRPSPGGAPLAPTAAARPQTHHSNRQRKPAAAAVPWWPTQGSVAPPSEHAAAAASSASIATSTPAATPTPSYQASELDAGSSRPGSSAAGAPMSARDAAAKQERERHRIELDNAWRRHSAAVQQLDAESQRRIHAEDAAAELALAALHEREASKRLEVCLQETVLRAEFVALLSATWRAAALSAEHELRVHVCRAQPAVGNQRELVIRDSDLLRAFRATEVKLAMALSELKLRGWVPPAGFDESSGLVPRVASAGQQQQYGAGVGGSATASRPASLPTRPQTHAGSRRR